MGERGGGSRKEEATDELVRIQRHEAEAAAVAVVPPAEGDLAVLELDQAVIGEGHPMRVASQVVEDLGGAAEGGLQWTSQSVLRAT